MNKKLLGTSTSSVDQDDLSNEEHHIQNFAKRMLRGHVFMGIFHEKRYVETLKAYRDVVSIAKDDKDLIRDLVVVKNTIETYFTEDHWAGITTPDIVGAPANHCIWVQLPEDQVFGCYWFKIKTVKFKEREAILRIEVLRSVDTPCNKASTTNPNANNNEPLDFNLIDVKQYFKNSLKHFVNNIATAHNVKETIIFTCVMLATTVTGSIEVIKFLCDFLLKFMREISNFVSTTTPIFIGLINLVGKSIGGLYMLIAYMWSDRKRPAPVNDPYYFDTRKPMLSYYDQRPAYYRRALPSAGRRRGPTITEIS